MKAFEYDRSSHSYTLLCVDKKMHLEIETVIDEGSGEEVGQKIVDIRPCRGECGREIEFDASLLVDFFQKASAERDEFEARLELQQHD